MEHIAKSRAFQTPAQRLDLGFGQSLPLCEQSLLFHLRTAFVCSRSWQVEEVTSAQTSCCPVSFWEPLGNEHSMEMKQQALVQSGTTFSLDSNEWIAAMHRVQLPQLLTNPYLKIDFFPKPQQSVHNLHMHINKTCYIFQCSPTSRACIVLGCCLRVGLCPKMTAAVT